MQTSGQTRDVFCLIASSVSALTVLTSSLVPAFLLHSDRERCEAAFQSPSAGAARQPTRCSSVCTDLVKSACDGPALREVTSTGFCGPGAAFAVGAVTTTEAAAAPCVACLAFSAATRTCSATRASASAFACASSCAPAAARRACSC